MIWTNKNFNVFEHKWGNVIEGAELLFTEQFRKMNNQSPFSFEEEIIRRDTKADLGAKQMDVRRELSFFFAGK